MAAMAPRSRKIYRNFSCALRRGSIDATAPLRSPRQNGLAVMSQNTTTNAVNAGTPSTAQIFS
jgi:hypothetical protein